MSQPKYAVVPCSCERCVVANTDGAVRLPTPPGGSLVVLHGKDAADYLRAQQGQTERVGQIGERLRGDLMKGQRSDF